MGREVVIVTGAGRGLGEAYALACSRKSAAVVVNDINQAGAEHTCAQIRAEGGRAIASVGSVADADYVERLIKECVAEFGKLTAVVNNAGVLHGRHLWDERADEVRGIVETNLIGTIYCARAASRHMLDHGGGAIVNVTSGSQFGVEKLSTYGATKGAITTLTLAWAKEGRPHNIRVNAISPTATTPMLDEWDANPAQRESRRSYGQPGQVAPLAAFLASERSAPLSGYVVRSDGTQISVLTPAHYDSADSLSAVASEDEFAAFFARLQSGVT